MGDPDAADSRYGAHVSGGYLYMGKQEEQAEINDDVSKSHKSL